VIANEGGCYTNTSAAKHDIKRLKLIFESYRVEVLKVDRTGMARGGKKVLREMFKGAQKEFATAKRDLRTLKRTAKLGGKKCVWARSTTQPPTELNN